MGFDSDDDDVRPSRTETKQDRSPYKHKIAEMRVSKYKPLRLLAESYDRQQKLAKQRRAEVINELRQQAREEARASPERKIAEAAAERLKLLQRATKFMRADRQLQQLRGREEEFTDFWRAMKLAALKHGRPGSDAEIAAVFEEITRGTCSRHQARSRRQIVEHLEDREHIWQEVAARGA